MPSMNFELIHQAMQSRKIVLATYNGYERAMCPHTLGYKNGREKALFYQFAGDSKSGLGEIGSPENWRCLFVEQLSDVRIEEGEWHTSSGGHMRPQPCVDDVVAEVTAG